MKTGIELIAEERVRQVEKGYNAAHDDGIVCGQLVIAAFLILDDIATWPSTKWSLDLVDYVTTKYAGEPIRLLTIAGALIAAEIERLQRMESHGKQ